MNTYEKFEEIAMSLEGYHSIFYRLWSIGMPVITEDIPTAAVGFDKYGNYINFFFNPKFMEKLSKEELCFVVAHECMHLILNHGKRLRGLIPEIANVTADVVINEELINRFGFSPELPVIKDLPACTIATVFEKRDMQVEPFREFEYYYKQLINDMEEKGQIQYIGIGKLIDSHEGLAGTENTPENIKNEIENILGKMSKEELQELDNVLGDNKDKREDSNKQAGDGSFFTWVKTFLKPKLVRKWESFIKDWTIAKHQEKYRTQWRMVNRRFALISKGDLLIPSDNEIEDKNESMIDLVFYMDVSGSCHSISEKFFKAAKSIPIDKFIIDAYAFDTALTKIDIKSDKMPYGGGTSFHQLESNLIKRKRYPSAVFVLTDGYGTDVSPKYPDRWHVFLTEGGSKENFKNKVNFHKFEEVYV